MRLHQLADGSVIVEVEGGSYRADLATFRREHGEDFPPQPEGATERLYEPGVRHVIKQGTNVVDGGPMPWPEGDAILAQTGRLLRRQDTRQYYGDLFVRMAAEQEQAQEIDETKRKHAAAQAEIDAQTAEYRAKFEQQQAEAAALAAENKARFEAQEAEASTQRQFVPPTTP